MQEIERANPDLHWREVFNQVFKKFELLFQFDICILSITMILLQYDTDGSGHISLQELKVLINAGRCSDIPRHVINQIMKKADRNNDGKLNFHEFLEMIHRPENQSHFQHLSQKYIKMIVPSRKAHLYRATDTTGTHAIFILFTNTKNNPNFIFCLWRVIAFALFRVCFCVVRLFRCKESGLAYADGQYEEEYTCWPPAICMIIISVIEFTLFMIDAFVNHPKGTGPIATELIYNPYKRNEAWRFLTYMFVHIG